MLCIVVVTRERERERVLSRAEIVEDVGSVQSLHTHIDTIQALTWIESMSAR